MTDEPLARKRKPIRGRRRPSEVLFEFSRGANLYRCELRDHGAFGVAIKVYRNQKIMRHRRFKMRDVAVQWAQEQRTALEKGGA